MIHTVIDGYVISDEGGWLAGLYSDEKSARLAFKNRANNHYCFLESLNNDINIKQGRPITTEDIKKGLNHD